MSIADFQVVIGLEVHAQLLTLSKIFCGCSTRFGAEPNEQTCPVCLGLPGALPVLNRKVVDFTVRTGLALDCEIRRRSVWSRKNYFYPDLPKGYQISQYELPICEHGHLDIETSAGPRSVRIDRIHMEEDAGKSQHDGGGGLSLVDFNRACVPLMEIVSAPDLRSAGEASDYLKALRDILVYLEVNDGNLEEGSLRCDANVSVMPRGSSQLGQRCEIKNLNSFRFIRQAIDREVARQVELIESGGRVVQETRLYDPDRNETRPMRSKEDAHDYRYFPEPDLLPLVLDEPLIERQRGLVPELPRAKVDRYQRALGLPEADARTLAADRAVAELFDACAALYADPRKLAHWFTGEVLRHLKEKGMPIASLGIVPAQLAELLRMVDDQLISANTAKDVFAEMLAGKGSPRDIVKSKGLEQVSDTSAIEAIVDRAIAESPTEVERYRAGKTQLLGFFVGKVMKGLGGKGNPAVVNALIKKKLGP